MTISDLQQKTREELRVICENLNLHVTTKTRKDDMIDLIIEAEELEDDNEIDDETDLVAMNSNVGTFLVKDELKSYISVSCGASSGNYLVVGKTVSDVVDFLSEALNITNGSEPLVNGVEVGPLYRLRSGDSLEFVTKAGEKG